MRQVTILQTFPLPLWPSVGNCCHLAQAAPFAGVFSPHIGWSGRKGDILNRVPFLEWFVGKVSWSDGKFSCL